MAEIKTPLVHLAEGETFTADSDGALVITAQHSHSDILRYIVADVGKDDVLAMLEFLDEGVGDEPTRKRQ